MKKKKTWFPGAIAHARDRLNVSKAWSSRDRFDSVPDSGEFESRLSGLGRLIYVPSFLASFLVFILFLCCGFMSPIVI